MNKNLKLVEEGDKHFTFQAPNGAKMKVAKKGLPPIMLQGLQAMKPQKLEEGGTVAGQQIQAQDAAIDKADREAADAAAAVRGNYLAAVDPGATQPNSGIAAQIASANPGISPIANLETLQQVQQVPSVDQTAGGTTGQNTAPAHSPNYAGQLQNYFNQYKTGTQNQAAAEGQQYAQQATAQDQYNQQLQTFNEQAAQIRQQKLDDLQRTFQDVQNSHIDPNRIWQNKSDGQKAATLIGIMLGGFNISHNPNQVTALLNHQIDRDIEAQKANLDTKKTLYGYNLEKLRDADLATQETRLQMQAAMMGQMNSVALKSKSQQTQSIAQQNIAKAGMQLVPEVANMSYNQAKFQMGQQALQGAAQSGSSQSPVNYDRFKQLQVASQMGIPGAPSKENLDAATKEAQNVEEARALRNSWLKDFNELDGQVLAGTLSPNQRDARVSLMADKIVNKTGGRITPERAQKAAEAMFPARTDLGAETRQVKRQKGEEFWADLESGTPTLNQWGLKNPVQPQYPIVKARPKGQPNAPFSDYFQLPDGSLKSVH